MNFQNFPKVHAFKDNFKKMACQENQKTVGKVQTLDKGVTSLCIPTGLLNRDFCGGFGRFIHQWLALFGHKYTALP